MSSNEHLQRVSTRTNHRHIHRIFYFDLLNYVIYIHTYIFMSVWNHPTHTNETALLRSGTPTNRPYKNKEPARQKGPKNLDNRPQIHRLKVFLLDRDAFICAVRRNEVTPAACKLRLNPHMKTRHSPFIKASRERCAKRSRV